MQSEVREREEHTAGEATGPQLDLRLARHLFNRFGFGGTYEELDAAVGRSAAEVFDEWLRKDEPYEVRPFKLIPWSEYGCDQDGNEIAAPVLDGLEIEQINERRKQMRLEDKQQLRDYLNEWLVGVHANRALLRDRMVGFWMGFFPASVRATLRRYELLMQHQMLRRRSLGSFAEMLNAIVHDAAMLGYFDNDTNSKQHPNENFARELLELYSLGEGNYTEVDVREAARALTGYQGETGVFTFVEELHDFDEKTILGETSNFDGEGLVELLLEQPACARYVVGKLLRYFEGRSPTPTRLEDYACAFREGGYEIEPFLRRLALDPEFYSDEVLGQRVAAPLEWLMGMTRRLGFEAQPDYTLLGSAFLGQQLYAPPSVKGWEDGEAWLTHSALLERENIVAMLLGLVDPPKGKHRARSELPIAQRHRMELWVKTQAVRLDPPQLHIALLARVPADTEDEALVDALLIHWLPREATAALRRELIAHLRVTRDAEGLEGAVLDHAHAEILLRQLAMLILRAPEAQLC